MVTAAVQNSIDNSTTEKCQLPTPSLIQKANSNAKTIEKESQARASATLALTENRIFFQTSTKTRLLHNGPDGFASFIYLCF